MKEFLIVSAGSFFGGGLRFLVSKGMGLLIATPFPLGTFTVNILGCLLIGIFSSLPSTTSVFAISPNTRLLLTTGFCGGFTTFSTFMKESDSLVHSPLMLVAYIALSLALGMAAVVAGQHIASLLANTTL